MRIAISLFFFIDNFFHVLNLHIIVQNLQNLQKLKYENISKSRPAGVIIALDLELEHKTNDFSFVKEQNFKFVD